MKIAFITPSVSRDAGGIFEIGRRLGQCLNAIPNTLVSVYGLQDQHTATDLPAWLPLTPRTFPIQGLRAFGYSSGLHAAFLADAADLAHLHSLWMFPSVIVHRWSQSKKRPYLATPNGMLEPWALKNSAWKKRIAGLFYENRMLHGAACLQANTEKEAADFRAYGLKNPIAIIPNGIDLPLLENIESLKTETLTPARDHSAFPQFNISDLAVSGRKVLLYLGRIHPKKGLINLLRAWKSTLNSQPSTSNWLLAIAGWDQGGHEAELKSLATELGISWEDVRVDASAPRTRHSAREAGSLVFLGPQFGAAKAACYRNCDAFILPSFSEGVPMVVLEAWAYGKPALITPECNLPEAFSIGAAMRIETEVDSIEQGLRELLSAPESARREIGAKGQALIQQKFHWPEVAQQMRCVYEWMLGGSPRPNCVITI